MRARVHSNTLKRSQVEIAAALLRARKVDATIVDVRERKARRADRGAFVAPADRRVRAQSPRELAANSVGLRALFEARAVTPAT